MNAAFLARQTDRRPADLQTCIPAILQQRRAVHEREAGLWERLAASHPLTVTWATSRGSLGCEGKRGYHKSHCSHTCVLCLMTVGHNDSSSAFNMRWHLRDGFLSGILEAHTRVMRPAKECNEIVLHEYINVGFFLLCASISQHFINIHLSFPDQGSLISTSVLIVALVLYWVTCSELRLCWFWEDVWNFIRNRNLVLRGFKWCVAP